MKYLFTLGILFFLFTGSSFASTTIPPDTSQNGVIIDVQGSTLGSQYWGDNLNRRMGYRYQPINNHYVCQVDIRASKLGTATDSIRLSVRQDGTNLTNGTLIQTSQNVWLHSDLDGSYASFWFGTVSPPGNCFPVVSGKTYFFVLDRTGGVYTTDNYNFIYTNTSLYDEIRWFNQYGEATDGYEPSVRMFGITNAQGLSSEVVDTSSFCDGLGLFAEICNTVTFLFVPNTNVLQSDIEDLIDTLSSKAPFAYVIEALSLDFSETYANEDVPSISIPIDVEVAGIQTLDTSFDFNDEASLVADTAGLIRTTFVILLWLVFVFFIFISVRHII